MIITDKELAVFGENIKRLRLQRGMSQDELARLCGYTTRSSIAKIETGIADIPQKKIKLFANALNVAPGVITGSDPAEAIVTNQDPQEEYLVVTYRSFNDEGKDKLIRYAHDLDDTGKYQKNMSAGVSDEAG